MKSYTSLRYWIGLLLFISCWPIAFAQTYFPDPAFSPTLVKSNQGTVVSVVIQPDDKILLTGTADFVNDVPGKGINRLMSGGSLDSAFQTKVREAGTAVIGLTQQSKIITAGLYRDANQISKIQVWQLALDGTVEATFKTDLLSDLLEAKGFALQPDGKILIFGNDSNQNKQIKRLKTDGTPDATFNTGALSISSVIAVAVQPDGKILMAGNFTSPTDGQQKSLLRLQSNGSMDNLFFPMADYQPVLAMILQPDGKVLVGGNGITIANETSGLFRLTNEGIVDAAFVKDPAINTASINAIAVQQDNKIVVSKTFSSQVNGEYVTYNQIIRLQADGNLDNQLVSGNGADASFTYLAIQSNGKILASGNFNNYNGHPRQGLIRLNGADGAMDETFKVKKATYGEIKPVAWQTDGKLLVGGEFNDVNGKVKNNFVRLQADGSVDSTFQIGTGFLAADNTVAGTVNGVVVQANNQIVVGGNFASLNGMLTGPVVRLNANGTKDAAFQPDVQATYQVQALVVQADRKIILSTNESEYLIRLNENGSKDNTFQINADDNSVSQMVLQSDGKVLAAGSFYNNVEDNYEERVVRVNADGTADNTFPSAKAVNGSIDALALQPAQGLIVGGSFTSFGGVAANKIVRLTTSGSVDGTFKPALGDDDHVQGIVVQTDGKIVLTGNFVSLNKKVVRLNANGTLDNTFSIAGLDEPSYNAAFQLDNKLWVASQARLTRFTQPLSQTITFTPIPDKIVTDAPFTIHATASSGLPVTFTVVSGPVILEGDSVIIMNTGTVTIRATQAGNAAYTAAAPVEITFQIKGVPNMIAFEAIADKLVTDSPFPLRAAATSDLPVTFTVMSGPATVTGNIVTLTGSAGKVTIRASQAGDADFPAAPDVERSFQVNTILGLEKVVEELNIYPNPASEQFYVEVPRVLPETYFRLFNAQGQEVPVLLTPTSAGVKVEVHHLSPGFYVLQVGNGTTFISRKVVLE